MVETGYTNQPINVQMLQATANLERVYTSYWIFELYAQVNWVIICSDNGLALNRNEAITWSNDHLLWFDFLRINYNKILMQMAMSFNQYNAFVNAV